VTAIVTRDDGRVLVIKREDDGRWVPLGGVLELAEAPQEGCAREVLEETGYRVKVGPPDRRVQEHQARRRLVGIPLRIGGGEARTSKESTVVSWWTLEQIRRDGFSGVHLCSLHRSSQVCGRVVR
jgi:8-oxo-dGTP diphosphatase